MERVFSRAEILLPRDCDLTRWSVVACDQFTAQPEYWAALEQLTEGVPSTLHLMLPEAYLDRCDPLTKAKRINAEMRRCLEEGFFRALPDSYVYVERTLRSRAGKGLAISCRRQYNNENHAARKGCETYG